MLHQFCQGLAHLFCRQEWRYEPEHVTHALLLLECQPHPKRDQHLACDSLQNVTDAGTETALPGPTDQVTIEVEPTQQDRLIGEHHQYQAQHRIAWIDKLWQRC